MSEAQTPRDFSPQYPAEHKRPDTLFGRIHSQYVCNLNNSAQNTHIAFGLHTSWNHVETALAELRVFHILADGFMVKVVSLRWLHTTIPFTVLQTKKRVDICGHHD
jgi:hypothetical protein